MQDDRTDFAQEQRLDLPYWTMTYAICVSVDVPKYLDILTLVGAPGCNNLSCVVQLCNKSPCSYEVEVYKVLLLALEFPIFYEHFHDILEFLIIGINKENTTSSPDIMTHASTYLAIHCRVLKSFVFSSISPRTMHIHQVVSQSWASTLLLH